MKANLLQRNNKLELLHDSFLSLNIGFGMTYALFVYVTVSHLPVYAPEYLQRLLRAFASFLLRIAPMVVSVSPQVHRRSLLIWEVGFVLLTIAIASVALAIRRMLSGTRAGRFVLHPLAGIISLVAVPGCWFYIAEVTQLEPGARQHFFATYGLFFASEVILAWILLLLFRQRSLRWGTLIFIIHYIAWMYVMLAVMGPPNIASLLISPVFPLSGIVWLRYSRNALHT